LAYRDELTVVSTRGGRPGRSAECGFFDVEAIDEVYYTFTLVPVVPYERDTWFILHCWEPGGTPWVNSIPGFPIGYECCDPGIPGGTLVDEWDVAAFAVGNIGFDIPAFEVSPATEQVVGIPTWLAVTSPVDFAPVTAAAGPLWATATPVFREAVWEFGNDDEPVRCVDDVATVWQPGVDDQTSTCTYTYITNLEGEPFAGQVTVYWDIFWESSANPGVTEYWGEIAQASPVEFNVRELQAAID
jgi:hypothetical protein